MSNGGNLDLTNEQMRSLVIETLRSTRIDQLNSLRTDVAATAQRLELGSVQSQLGRGRREDRLTPHDFARAQDVMWDLIIEGVVRPGLQDGVNNGLPFFHVTEWGRRVLQEGTTTPYDPDEYLKRLKNDLPTLDPVIITYLNESLHTFRIGCLLSSTIALGCASEKALLLLIAAYGDSLPQAMKEKFKANTDGRMIKRQFDDLRKMLDSELRARLPYDLADGLDVELNAIFDFIRNQRNDAGHPTGKTIERERAYANLVVFPVYVKKVYAIINWVIANPRT
jgi:hypothetical protein